MKLSQLGIRVGKLSSGTGVARVWLLRGLLATLWTAALPSVASTGSAGLAGLTNPIVFVTQPPIPRELNSSVSNTFLSVVTLFGNHLSDTAHAARGGDLYLLNTNGQIMNLTRAAGFGLNGIQHTNGIAVRDPLIYWDASKLIFSMVVGAPQFSGDTNVFFWQLYELTNLTAVVAGTAAPVIVKVPNQPTNYNNVSPCYATDGHIIFTSDRPINGQAYLYPQRDEYKGAPTVSGTYSLDPATGNLRILEHLPSGGFSPFVDSFGRLIVTRWDHLVQDSSATGDRLGRTTNGAFTFSVEAPNATTLTNALETFPEPVDFDTNYSASLGVNPNGFNFLLPWALDQNGGNEEVLNHVGRHEILAGVATSFINDTNLIPFTNAANRAAFGIESANTNFFNNSLLQITEDPRNPGTYFGVDAPDISIFGGDHASGQIVTLTGPPSLNPTGMVINYITPRNGAFGPNSFGLYRNPLPLINGTLISAFTPTISQGVPPYGYDTNIGTASAPLSTYHFRLMTLTNTGTTWTTNQNLTGSGLSNVAVYWDGTTLVTNAGPLWELQPVAVRARTVPAPFTVGVNPIEQQVFAQENVDLATFQADLAQRGLALLVSRNVTARDAADKQQPYNLNIPGGVQTLGSNGVGKVYNTTHLQFLQADFLRGYNLGTTNILPGRRVLATPMHAVTAFNPPSSQSNAPIGGTELMSDGSQATLVPAGRAITWQLTGVTNESVVKERYWLNFRAGEIRTCANCHGINDKDQANRPSPTNAPFALRQLLHYWRTNSASTYQLTVNNSAGSGAYGAGSVFTLTASPPPSGQAFAQWTGLGVSNLFSATTLFTMPITNAVVSAVYTNLPAPQITSVKPVAGGQLQLSVHGTAFHAYIIQTSADLVTWSNAATNSADSNGILVWSTAINPAVPGRFFRIAFP